MMGQISKYAAARHKVDLATIKGLKAEDRVAELMAQGLDPQQIADICGYNSRASANAAMQRLRLKMGWQAS